MQTKEVKQWIERLRAEIAEEPEPSAVRARGGGPGTQRRQPDMLRCLTPTMRAFGHETINLRFEVVEHLAAEPDDMNLELLSRLAKVDADWKVRKAVAEMAAKISHPKAVDILTDLVKVESIAPAAHPCQLY